MILARGADVKVTRAKSGFPFPNPLALRLVRLHREERRCIKRRCTLLDFVSDGDISIIARSGASVAYCPRTHAAFGHPPHRFRDMLRAGVNVCLGTDSLASNPSLSILDELRFLRSKCHEVAPDELLALATIRGARALGFSQAVGSIARGKSADLVVVPLGSSTSCWHDIFDSSAKPSAVYIRGKVAETSKK